MGTGQNELRIEGIVHAERYNPREDGKQFLGAAIESPDGKVWIIDYAEQSPYHAFAGRHVVALGESYRPPGSQIIGWNGKSGELLGHFRVSNMRISEPDGDARIVEVGPEQEISGRFERTRDRWLSFVAENGDTFQVVNNPAGLVVGRTVEASFFAVQLRQSLYKGSERYAWVAGPYSCADLWKWRKPDWVM